MPIDYDDMMQSGATGLAAAYDEKDVMLYALGVGFGRDPLDARELAFVYENVEGGLKVPPTFASVISRGEAPPERQRMPQKSQINFMMVVDGERRITLHKPLPPKCDVLADERYLDILDKGEGKGAVLIQERVVREKASGEKLFTIVSSIFARGDGGFGGPLPNKHSQGGPQLHEIPSRAPDLVKDCDTRPDQALLYALSGDRNPLHRDPKLAQMVGFPRPILQGLCSYGTACRAILSTVAEYAPERIRQFDVRFSKPVFPGETLGIEIWADGGTISFRASVKERPGTVVLNNGLCLLT
jgi:acyl dehydratase